jgi:hypothetical protein
MRSRSRCDPGCRRNEKRRQNRLGNGFAVEGVDRSGREHVRVDFDATLSELLGLLGRAVFVEVRAPGDHEIATMRGTLTAGDDLGEFERKQGFGGPTHDRLLFTMREHPFPEGFFLDRRTFDSAEWRREDPDDELRISLRGGVVVVLIEDSST